MSGRVPMKPQKTRRNERERKRVHQVNQGFNKLRDRVPRTPSTKKLSKVETLREAIKYIEHLRTVLQSNTVPENPPPSHYGSPPKMMQDNRYGNHSRNGYCTQQQMQPFQCSPLTSDSSYFSSESSFEEANSKTYYQRS